jgi:nucleoid-associated protein YgaU
VTPTKKILLAAAFLVAGYGVASQLGAPNLQAFRQPAQLADSTPPAAEPAAPTALLSSATGTGPRLVPEVQPDLPTIFERDIEAAREPIGGDSRSAFELTSVSAPALALSANSAAANSAGNGGFRPRATLRNEAPRPLLVEPRTPVNINDVQLPIATNISSIHETRGAPTAPAVTNLSTVAQAHFSNGGSAAGTTASMADAIAARAMPYVDSNPLPFAQITERDQARSHIIVDGDSLAKLAERYLNDPQRANEIYELNRTLLSHPDVLPIGAEITIPARSANTLQSANDTPQSLLTEPAAIHAASRGGLVPVRPIPTGSSMVPRAQLSRPQPVAGTPVAGTLRVP